MGLHVFFYRGMKIQAEKCLGFKLLGVLFSFCNSSRFDTNGRKGCWVHFLFFYPDRFVGTEKNI